MTNAEHLIENALSCVYNGKRAEDFVEMEISSKANIWNRDYTAEEVLEMIWEVAMYVKYNVAMQELPRIFTEEDLK